MVKTKAWISGFEVSDTFSLAPDLYTVIDPYPVVHKVLSVCLSNLLLIYLGHSSTELHTYRHNSPLVAEAVGVAVLGK